MKNIFDITKPYPSAYDSLYQRYVVIRNSGCYLSIILFLLQILISVVRGKLMLWDGGKVGVAGHGPDRRLVGASIKDGPSLPTLFTQVKSNQSCHDKHHLPLLPGDHQTL